MDPVPLTHPSAQELTAFGAGKLPPEQAEQVASHLATCPQCLQAAEHLPPDSFLGKLRAAVPRDRTMMPAAQPPAGPKALPAKAQAGLAGVLAALAGSGKYQVLGKVGEGGMGSVWKAKHAILDCLVAIKVMSPEVTSHPEARDRFLREMRAMLRLQHPHIVRAFDAEQVGDLLFLVMEYVAGITLDRLVKQRGPLPIGLACDCIAQTAEGLQHAHEQGMVHRDIKPANLMITPRDKQVKVLDFGLVRDADSQGRGSQTQLGTFMGTAEYVAPEQAMDARSADARADIYSLGCTLYFLLAGRPPFDKGNRHETAVAQLYDDPPPLPGLRPEVPSGLWNVVARMMAKRPADRYQNAAGVARALQPFLTAPTGADSAAVPPLPPGAGGSPTALGTDTGRMTPLPASSRVVPPPPLPQEAPFELPAEKDLRRGQQRGTKGKRRGWLAYAAVALVGVVSLALIARMLLALFAPPPENGGPKQPPREEIDNSIGMKMRLIPAGTFLMGSPRTEAQRADDEHQHEVEITKAFYLGVYEVTQKQFRQVMGYNPSHFSPDGKRRPGASYLYEPSGGKTRAEKETGDYPVENVSWEEAREFCQNLSASPEEKTAGRVYRLPTEEEWEYACRGRASTYQVFHFGNTLSSTQANFDGNFPYGGADKGPNLQRPVAVNTKGYDPNAFGLYHMHGNVWEWCADRNDRARPGPAEDFYRVIRGGSLANSARECRSAVRYGYAPGDRFDRVGFRVALVPSEPKGPARDAP